MFQAMELIDISSPEAARKSISTVMAHLRALDEFLERISCQETTERQQVTDQLPDKVDKVVPCRIDLEVQCSSTAPGDTVVVVGSCPELGNWKAERGLPLCTSQELYPKWTGTLEIESCAACDVQFKLAILRPSSHEWEQATNNRNFSFPKEQDEHEQGHWKACLTFNRNDEVNVVKVMPANTKEKKERPLPNLLLRGHGVDTQWDEVKVEKPAISQQVLDKTFRDKVIGHSRGLITEAQRKWSERQTCTVGQIPLNRSYLVSCQKGSKRTPNYEPPNQDNWSVTAFKSGWTLFCVHDGHGPYGHFVSTRTVQTVPWYLMESGFDKNNIDEDCIEQALLSAFQKSQADLVRYAVANNKDIAESGSTALAVLLKGNKIYTANLGDCRCVVGSAEGEVIFQTEDHKPQQPKERARIEAAGGEVRYDQPTHRIYVKGTDDPGLAVARAFGDLGLKDYGVVAIPQVNLTEVDVSKEVFVFIASDGIWEFMDSDEVVGGLASKLRKGGAEAILGELHSHARCKWTEMCGTYCDDITSVLIQLR